VPSLAQTDSQKSRTEPALVNSVQTVALNTDRSVTSPVFNYAIPSNTVATSKTKFSPAKFQASLQAMGNSNINFEPQTTIYELQLGSTKQFKDDLSEQPSRSKISFVPSRGFKLPE
jgi:hypothetical protein